MTVIQRWGRMRAMSRVMTVYLIVGALGFAAGAILFATARCSPGTCMEGPAYVAVTLLFLFFWGFLILGTIWLVTELTKGRRKPVEPPPMPAFPADGREPPPPLR